MERQILKKSKVEDVGVLRCCVICIEDEHLEWIDAEEFSLARLASEIGVDIGREVKVKVTLEVVQEPCLFCGCSTTGDRLCEQCHAVVCDQCAKTDSDSRYCPHCFNKKKIEQLESKLL